MAINLDELTNGTTVVKEVDGINTYTWEGTAVFDVLVRIINENLKVQFDSGRIVATDYANVYIAGLQTCITESMNYIMQKDNLIKDEEVKQAQIASMESDTSIKKEQSAKDLEIKTAQKNKLVDDLLTAAKQRDLYQRQIVGFDDNKYQKLFESQLSSWGLMFSSGMLTEKPTIITGDKVSQLYTKLTESI